MQNEAETKKATRQAELYRKKSELSQGSKRSCRGARGQLKNGSDVCALLTMDMLKSRPRLPHNQPTKPETENQKEKQEMKPGKQSE